MIMTKFAFVICELSACEKENLKDFIARKSRLTSLDNNDKCLKRILAIFDDNDEREISFVASLLQMTTISLKQKIAKEKVFEFCHVKNILKELLTTLTLHDIDHESISKSTIFVDDCERVHLRDFMRLANLRRLDQNVQDLFDVFKSITTCRSNFKFYKYLSETFDSIEHARIHFLSPDVAFDEIM